MSTQRKKGRIARGHAEEATRTPLTPAEEESSRRPAGITPGVSPGFVGSEEPVVYTWDERDAAYNRLKELNPDDFE